MSAPNTDATPSVTVHLCDRGDRPEQVRLFNHCFKKKIDERALVWRYDENPHGHAVSFVSRTCSDGVSAGSERVSIRSDRVSANGERVSANGERVSANGEGVSTSNEGVSTANERVSIRSDRGSIGSEGVSAGTEGVSASSERESGATDPVAGYACSPRSALSFGDEATRATIGETGDVMTHPAWRKKGLFSALDRASMLETKKLGWPLVFGLPNRRSAHIFLELGWEKIGTLRPWTFVLKSDSGARRERAKEGRVAGWLTPLGARRGRAGRRALARQSAQAGALQANELSRFPAEVEALSRAVEKRFALMVRRDAGYLDWRFTKSPSGLHRVIGISTSGGELAGYAVVQLPRPDECTGYLVDVLARDDAAVAAAIESGLARLESAGASLVQATAIDGSWWNERLRGAGFLPPKPANHLIVILHTHDRDHPLARAARDASAWYLTDGDRDDETMG